ncbi:hypothetical protein CDIK_1918 [Cucumispora dikerogammari]|nr:hypothetical protein CDIK_1918 [Cucumispora dikerogammari]
MLWTTISPIVLKMFFTILAGNGRHYLFVIFLTLFSNIQIFNSNEKFFNSFLSFGKQKVNLEKNSIVVRYILSTCLPFSNRRFFVSTLSLFFIKFDIIEVGSVVTT